MNNSILYLGGMCGDIILKMIDKSSIKPSFIHKDNHFEMDLKKSRTIMKKFWKYSVEQKNLYYSRINKIPNPYYTLTHDTEYNKDKPTVIQLYCSDLSMLEWISKRFKIIHESFDLEIVVNRVCEQQNLNPKNFIEEYAELVRNWQEYHTFENRFDMADICSDHFVDLINEKFIINDIDWAKKVYDNWKSINNNLNI